MAELYPDEITEGARTVIRDVCGMKENERVLIVTNPEKNVMAISMALYDAAVESGGEPVIIIQKQKSLLDFADKAVIAAFKTNPEIILSISADKIGKDEEAMAHPYVLDGQEYNHIFDYQMDATKTLRGVWTPGVTIDMFARTAGIDYKLLQERCARLSSRFENAVSVHVTAPAGTDITLGVKGRKPFDDNGDFSTGGKGGNIPAGEVFISPENGSCKGRIVYDGSMSYAGIPDGIITEPIICDFTDGYISAVYDAHSNPPSPESDAGKLLASITASEQKSLAMKADGTFSAEKADAFFRNSRHIGELGIGLNPAAAINGNMLEDEKAFHTCHFAVGSNYDNDADTFIHLDGVVRDPTIVITYEDGSTFTVEENGELKI